MTAQSRRAAAFSGDVGAPNTLGAPFGAAAAGEDAFTAAVIRLLDDARLALAGDRNVAEAGIAHAAAQRSADGTDQSSGTGGAMRTAARGGLAPWQIRRVMSHIDASLGGKIGLADLGRFVGLSTSHFARAFKASIGEPAHAYIIRRRIERAQQLMLMTSEPLCQIALACGLCDQAHLSRMFRRAVGMTPNAWRRQWSRDGYQLLSKRPQPHPADRGDGPEHGSPALNGRDVIPG